MMQDISVDELAGSQNIVLIDVRSENEFREGTIPGAYNIPLFNNEERARIGTVYTRESPKKATELGLEIASGKLPSLYKQIERLAGKDAVTLFCWRGGMRSKSLSVILDLMGLSVYRLSGGYKAYRRSIVDFFEVEYPYHVVVLKGNTGTGKTKILRDLKAEGYPAIDLEGLANNRGSVFGAIGLGTQPTQKQFESLLFLESSNYHRFSYVLVECESQRIGKVSLPNSFYRAMQEGTAVLVYDTLDGRAKRLVKEYTNLPENGEDLKAALERLKKRIGKANLDELLGMLTSKEYEQFSQKIILEYYDRLYGYPNEDNEDYEFSMNNSCPEAALGKLKQFLDARFNIGIKN